MATKKVQALATVSNPIYLMHDKCLPPRSTDHTVKPTANTKKFVFSNASTCSNVSSPRTASDHAIQIDYVDINKLIFRFQDEVQGFKHTYHQEYVEYLIDQGLEPTEPQATVHQAQRILILTRPP